MSDKSKESNNQSQNRVIKEGNADFAENTRKTEIAQQVPTPEKKGNDDKKQ